MDSNHPPKPPHKKGKKISAEEYAIGAIVIVGAYLVYRLMTGSSGGASSNYPLIQGVPTTNSGGSGQSAAILSALTTALQTAAASGTSTATSASAPTAASSPIASTSQTPRSSGGSVTAVPGGDQGSVLGRGLSLTTVGGGSWSGNTSTVAAAYDKYRAAVSSILSTGVATLNTSATGAQQRALVSSGLGVSFGSKVSPAQAGYYVYETQHGAIGAFTNTDVPILSKTATFAQAQKLLASNNPVSIPGLSAARVAYLQTLARNGHLKASML